MFIISLAELRGSHDSNDRLRATLRKLQTTLVEARLPNGKTRTVQMLGAADLEDEERRAGTLEYDFHRKLVPLLRDSEIYTRMEVKVLSAFTSKYSLHLYEALAARINLRKTAETLEIGTLRQWLGVPDGKLSRWQSLKIKALEPAVREVNAYSPIAVQAEPVYRRRKVTAVKLSWSRKKPFSPAEQAASLEVNRHSAGRKARTTGAVEQAVDGGGRACRGRARASRRVAAAHPRRGIGGDRRAPRHPRGPCRLATLGRRHEGADPQPGRAFRRFLQAACERAEVGCETGENGVPPRQRVVSQISLRPPRIAGTGEYSRKRTRGANIDEVDKVQGHELPLRQRQRVG